MHKHMHIATVIYMTRVKVEASIWNLILLDPASTKKLETKQCGLFLVPIPHPCVKCSQTQI